MATKSQQELAITALVNELWIKDVDVLKVCDDLAFQMLGSPGDHDTRMAHNFLMEIVIRTIGHDKYWELREKKSCQKFDIEDF